MGGNVVGLRATFTEEVEIDCYVTRVLGMAGIRARHFARSCVHCFSGTTRQQTPGAPTRRQGAALQLDLCSLRRSHR